MRPWLLPLIAVLLCCARPAHADYEETERRLKAVGIDKALRARIHKAIDRGVAFLASRQGRRGSFLPRAPGRTAYRTGISALSALALRHAGTPAARKAVDKALVWLLGPGGKGQKAVLGGSYTGGITAMLLMADRSHRDVAHAITVRIAASQRRLSGWWGYRLTDARTTNATTQTDLTNLSTSQFAALGLWAGRRLKAPIPSAVWMRTLEGMIRSQTKDGSWAYFPQLARGYQTGTFMGLANLLLAEQALAPHLAVNPRLKKRALAARLRAVAALRRDGRSLLARLEPTGTTLSGGIFYKLYALEKACLFAGLEKLGDLPWYKTGAEALLDMQNPDGGWSSDFAARQGTRRARHPQSYLIETSFALLFLLRSSEAYRPVTPSPVDRAVPAAPVTPHPPPR